jgi:hypothetical protein
VWCFGSNFYSGVNVWVCGCVGRGLGGCHSSVVECARVHSLAMIRVECDEAGARWEYDNTVDAEVARRGGERSLRRWWGVHTEGGWVRAGLLTCPDLPCRSPHGLYVRYNVLPSSLTQSTDYGDAAISMDVTNTANEVSTHHVPF